MGIIDFFKSRKQRELDILKFKEEEKEEQLKQESELKIALKKEKRKKMRKAEKEKKYLASKNEFELKYVELVEKAKTTKLFNKVLFDDVFLCKIKQKNAENDAHRFILPFYYDKDGYKKSYAYIVSENRFTDKIDDYNIDTHNKLDYFVIEDNYVFSTFNYADMEALTSYKAMMEKAYEEAEGMEDVSVNIDELITVEKELNDYHRNLKLRNEKINKNINEVKKTYPTADISTEKNS